MSEPEEDDIRLMIDRNSPYITADDLLDQDAPVTIVSVKGGTVFDPKSQKKARKPMVVLKGWDKPFACNITNARTIANVVGGFRASQWVGKRVTLYPTTCMNKGETVACIRVRPKAPDGPGIPQSALRQRTTGTV